MEEGVEIINKNPYGNGCCIFTENGRNAREFSQNTNIGMVGINIPLPVPSSFHSFGGWKNSLFGDLNIYGPDGLRFYTQRKTVTQKWVGSQNKSKINLSMPNNKSN